LIREVRSEEGTRKNVRKQKPWTGLRHKIQSGQCFGRDSNQAAHKYESKLLLPGQLKAQYSVRTISVLAEIQTRQHPNTSQKYYCLGCLRHKIQSGQSVF